MSFANKMKVFVVEPNNYFHMADHMVNFHLMVRIRKWVAKCIASAGGRGSEEEEGSRGEGEVEGRQRQFVPRFSRGSRGWREAAGRRQARWIVLRMRSLGGILMSGWIGGEECESTEVAFSFPVNYDHRVDCFSTIILLRIIFKHTN